jgi:hypothetical protein
MVHSEKDMWLATKQNIEEERAMEAKKVQMHVIKDLFGILPTKCLEYLIVFFYFFFVLMHVVTDCICQYRNGMQMLLWNKHKVLKMRVEAAEN